MNKRDLLPKEESGLPYLLLAPMEGVGDEALRKALASMGGFHEAVRYFIRVPKGGDGIKSLAKKYNAKELSPIPLIPQIMGAEKEHLAAMAKELEQRGAPRIDLNCGCPSNIVTGKGAGSGLLKDPHQLEQIVEALVLSVSIPISVKMRSGYDSEAFFSANLKAVENGGASFITLHPRTKIDGYHAPAKWELIKKAKDLLKIPVVGNSEIRSAQDAHRMLQETGCDALMIGRGALMNPLLFQEIRASFAKTSWTFSREMIEQYARTYFSGISSEVPSRVAINKLKQFFGFLFTGKLQREEVLRRPYLGPEECFSFSLETLLRAIP